MENTELTKELRYAVPVKQENTVYYDPEMLNSPYFKENGNFAHYYFGNEILSYDKNKYSPLEIQFSAMLTLFEKFLRGHV